MAVAKLNIPWPVLLGGAVLAYVLWKVASQKQQYFTTGTVWENQADAEYFASQDALFK